MGHAAPACTLVILAPRIAEVLPGTTRISAIFVFPIEVAIWGGEALLNLPFISFSTFVHAKA
jgi:hypothetical protein